LPEAEEKNLYQVCCELGMDAIAYANLLAVAKGICFLHSGKEIKLASQRQRELEQVADLSGQLNAVLQGLCYDDKGTLNEALQASGIAINLREPDPLREAFLRSGREPQESALASNAACEHILLVGDLLLTLQSLAQQQKHGVTGQKTGRPPMNELLSGYITNIAECAHRSGINVARGGSFNKLCEAVFSAAGIQTDPDAAIRKFTVELLPTYLELWDSAAFRGCG